MCLLLMFLFCPGTDMLSKLLKMQVLEDDEELAYGGEDTPGTERKDIEVRFPPDTFYLKFNSFNIQSVFASFIHL